MNTVPLPPTPFLGREQDLQQVVDLVRRPEVRFLTLTGPAGIGKTRLALQAAAELRDDFPDGVFVVPLAALPDPELVPSAIAETLGIREERGQSVRERLRSFLAAKQLLLVLDTLDHLAAAAPTVGALLETAPGLTVVATSRVALRLRAEREYALPPLDVPRRDSPPSPEQLSQVAAVQLFIARAQAVTADFTLDHETAPAVAELCWRLDGLPLAIELAAARVGMLSPQAMLAQLAPRLPMPTGDARDAPERPRTLHNTIAWSFDLLEPEEQHVFQRLAVFGGGMTLESAAAVANPDGQRDIVGSLQRLVEQSLLRQEVGPEGESRFRMLEPLRDFGLHHLSAAGAVEEARARHAAFFLALAQEAAPSLHGPTQRAWLGRLATEHDNLRSALAWALTHQPETALRLAAALHWFWFYRGHLSEGGDWTERALASGASAPPEVRVRALNGSSAFARERADTQTAAYRAEEAFAVARSVGDRSGEGWARVNLGMIAAQRGEWQRAAALHTEAEAQFVSIGERHGAAEAIYHQALVAGLAGDGDRQRALLERSLAESRASGGGIQAAWILSSLGHDALEQGDLDRARPLLEEALATARDFRFGMLEGNALLGLVEVTAQQGDVDLTATYLHDAEVTYREMEYGLNLAYGLNEFGYLALDHGNAERACTLFTEALGLARDFGDQAARTGFLHSLGDALRAQGDAGGAARQYQAGLLRAQGAHDARVATECLTGIAGLATQFGRHAVAARLFGAVETLRETVGPPGSPYAEERQAQDMAAVRDALGTEAASGRGSPVGRCRWRLR